jgi:hypothetical protein
MSYHRGSLQENDQLEKKLVKMPVTEGGGR